MTKEEIFNKMKDLIVDQLGVNREQVEMKTNCQDDLGADSLDQIELVMAAEEEFGVPISEEDAEKVKTVSDGVDLIAKLLEQKN